MMSQPESVSDRPERRGGDSLGPTWLGPTSPRQTLRPKTDPSGLKTLLRITRGLGSGHSISIGEPAIGPPRSGFVLRLCIRKADEAWGEAALGHGLADTRFCTTRTPMRPTFGVKLGSEARLTPRFDRVTQLAQVVFDSARHTLDFDFLARNPDYESLVARVNVDGFDWLDFHLADARKQVLFYRGAKAAQSFLRKFDWAKYKQLRTILAEAGRAGAVADSLKAPRPTERRFRDSSPASPIRIRVLNGSRRGRSPPEVRSARTRRRSPGAAGPD